MQELGGLMEGKVDLDGAAESAAAQAKQEALAKAREAALTAVEEAQRPLDEAKAAFEDAAGQLLAQGEALQARAAAFNPHPRTSLTLCLRPFYPGLRLLPLTTDPNPDPRQAQDSLPSRNSSP